MKYDRKLSLNPLRPGETWFGVVLSRERNVTWAWLALTAFMILAGCRNPAASVKVGMSADQVRQVLGEPLITGRIMNTIPGQQVSQERWTYAQGKDGLVIVMENGAVKGVAVQASTAGTLRAKIHEGMTPDAVITAIGKPANGLEGGIQPNGIWTYADPVAPVETLMVVFENGKVKSAQVMHNAAYH